MKHPYVDARPEQSWSRAMSWPPAGQIDPVSRAVRIASDAPVATMGSCFAQHIARHLAASGCHYFVPERAPPDLSAADAAARQFGLFSARYGNVYTVRQAVQLFDRAFGRFQPRASAWAQGDRWVDPFRPQVEPGGFDSPAAVAAARAEHLAHVRTVFEQSHWLVFTLGLTEAWTDREDGAVFPLAPGVSGGVYEPARHGFVNSGIDEVRADLDGFIVRLHEVNPACRLMLTVSPVPLAATYESRHVWTSTTVSKAILRVAADEAERRHPQVLYFPSYEIVTSPAAGGRYYADDLRQVTEAGVRHVMRMFSRHFLGGDHAGAARLSGTLPAQISADVVCDEETIERAMRLGGQL